MPVTLVEHKSVSSFIMQPQKSKSKFNHSLAELRPDLFPWRSKHKERGKFCNAHFKISMLPTMFFLNDQQGAGTSLARDREGTRGQDHGDAGERPDQESGQGVH